MAAAGLLAVLDYQRAVVIYAPTDGSGSLAARIARGQMSPLFAHHADYAAATNAVPPASRALGLVRATHALLDTRLMMASEAGHVQCPDLPPCFSSTRMFVHHHAAVGGLAHVVDRQQAHLHGGQRFHLHAGAAHGLDLRGAVHGAGGGVELEVDRHARERQRVAQRDQVGRALGALDGGDARDADHVALLRLAAGHQRQRGRQHADAAGGAGHAVGLGLGRHVHHVGLALGVEVGQRGGLGRVMAQQHAGNGAVS
jgi:hypothetical protein